jgi:uridine kinase
VASAESTPRKLAVRDLARRVLAASPTLGNTRLVCIDGPAGSGKTTLAEALRGELSAMLPSLGAGWPVPVICMDELYEGWRQDLDDVTHRLIAQLLTPISEGRAGRYQRYDWIAERFAEWHDVPAGPVLVIEGVGSAPLAADALITVLVWVEAPAAVRLERGLRRDGEALRDEWERWMVHERDHAERQRTRERADVVIDGAADPGQVGGASAGDFVVVLEDRRP